MSKNLSFEEAYAKLEEILEKMTKSDVSLDSSLAYYDEADKLLQICSKKLEEAEKKIEIITKNRDGSVTLKEFTPNTDQVLTRDEHLN